MCECEQRKLKVEMRPIIEAGNDLVAAIERANWGTIRHPTMHMTDAIAVWKETTCLLQPEKVD